MKVTDAQHWAFSQGNTRYKLTWTNHEGRRKTLVSYSHDHAIQLLNILVLDNGYSDARLTTIRKARIRETLIDTGKL